jgi:Capsule assembly protein Wzi
VRRRLLVLTISVALLAFGAGGSPLLAQCPDPGSLWTSVTPVQSFADERRRIAQDLGRCSTNGELIRSALSLTPRLAALGPFRWATVAPAIDATFNSALPFSLNDGPQWAGRGVTTTLSGGVRVETDHLSISIAPDIVFQQNRVFSVLPSNATDRSSFASPWHSGVESADLPLRFGDRSQTIVYGGSSWIDYRAGPLSGGFSTDEQWWGPGIRNALVLSNNAPGIPQLYLRSGRPIATRIGDVEFRWLLGGLTESLFFDTLGSDNLRALSAAVATLRTAFDTGLTVGVARSVYAPVSGPGGIASHFLDVITQWRQSPDTSSARPSHPSDQLLSFFGRWVLPSSGLEIYGEWAKLFPPGLREMLVAPQSHQGFTVGLQWLNPLSTVTAVRLQAEATTLEQTPPSLRALVPSFYTSRFVPQGYTQRGQVIGAAIGPGSSSQWVAGDYLDKHWRFGVELGRIRWEDDVYYRTPNGVSFTAHDVSIYAGLRGGATVSGFDVDLEAISAKRLNYLFQSAVSGYAQNRAFDVDNFTLRLRVSPR